MLSVWLNLLRRLVAQEQADWPSSNYITVDLEVQLRSKARGPGPRHFGVRLWMILRREDPTQGGKERKIFVLEFYFFVCSPMFGEDSHFKWLIFF